ncbi:hypothetical protein A5659_24345 [Mycobacterium sp. 1165196.3]|uniref:hypothetical protein n=1 Tax=unclassified Mycobacterium TaxID=2642494 RepID=UPI0007FDD30A|nr:MULTISPECIES: hypothetical protein [unclassified Mycobacterium]OBJ00983.1 hypothetical protein A5624_07245 [Mycobacterium sp. 1482292.6]OBJ14271.1 hypothetical protein A5622_03995 [Mycobacterium sp. 1245801.1]OBJ94914.1 hypothetical protein A9W96_20045 [Mycobacterium sp. 1245852.3]OBK32246.1 hypothetical protein A5659_24345 [Mycobacterium sp. 1165196.3]OBK93864.1 hypothetical protein A5646_02340 [Mycobacterium sp. 1245499.0]
MKIRAIELIRAGWGAVLLAAPAEVLDHIHGVQVDRKALVVTRILGARHLTQAALSGVNPGPEVLAAGVWVDVVHSATALGLAVLDRRRARGGVTDAAVAATWAALGWRHLRAGRARTDGVRGRDRLARTVVGALPGGGGLMARAQAVRAQ